MWHSLLKSYSDFPSRALKFHINAEVALNPVTLYLTLKQLIIPLTTTADVQNLNGSKATNTDFIQGKKDS